MSFAPPTVERRSLIAKFRYATLFQATLIVALAVGAFAPTLKSLSDRARQRREQAKTEVVDAGVNNMARLLAMELGTEFLPELSSTLDELDVRVASGVRVDELSGKATDVALEERAEDQIRRLNERVAEKISYNGVLVDLVVAMPHVRADGTDARVYLFPDSHDTLAELSVEDLGRLSQVQRLTKLPSAPRDAGRNDDQARSSASLAQRESRLVDYLVRRAGELDGQAYLMPIRREGVPYGYAGMVVKTELISQQFESTWRDFWVGLEDSVLWLGALSLLALAGGAVFISVLAARLIRPLEGMREALAGIEAGDTGAIDPAALQEANARLAAVEADPLDEVGALRSSFMELSDNLAETLAQKADAMQRLKESTQQLQRADRLKLVGTLSYGLAHNLNNALAPIANVAHAAARRHADDAKLQQMMQHVLESVARSADIVSRLRDLTRVGSGESVPVQVNLVLDEALESVRRDMTAARISIERDLQDVPEIQGNPIELWEVFTNLLVNAREAFERHGETRPRKVAVRSRLVDGGVHVDIEDNGPGMTDDVQKKALEAWFSTKPGGDASGIGLWISQRIVTEHGGRLELQSTPGVGTRISMTLRGVQAATASAAGKEDASA